MKSRPHRCSWRLIVSGPEVADLRHEPLRIRRDRVERVLEGAPSVLLPVRRLADHGLKAWQQVMAQDPAVPIPQRPDACVAQGQAAPLPRGRARVGAEERIVVRTLARWCKFLGMDRRAFIVAVTGALLAAPLAAETFSRSCQAIVV